MKSFQPFKSNFVFRFLSNYIIICSGSSKICPKVLDRLVGTTKTECQQGTSHQEPTSAHIPLLLFLGKKKWMWVLKSLLSLKVGRQRGRETLRQCQAVKWKLAAWVVFSSEIADTFPRLWSTSFQACCHSSRTAEKKKQNKTKLKSWKCGPLRICKGSESHRTDQVEGNCGHHIRVLLNCIFWTGLMISKPIMHFFDPINLIGNHLEMKGFLTLRSCVQFFPLTASQPSGTTCGSYKVCGHTSVLLSPYYLQEQSRFFKMHDSDVCLCRIQIRMPQPSHLDVAAPRHSGYHCCPVWW